MAGRINSDDVAAVRDRTPIVDVVGEHLQLRSAGGGSLKGLCPFHEEKSPSFTVSPDRGLYYCFGCGEGGDVIGFVQKIDQLTFAEAVEKLAGRAGITLRYEGGGAAPGVQAGERTRLLAAHTAAAEYYAEQLASTSAADIGRRFLAERGFDLASISPFGVGYAPPDWDALAKHLRGRGFSAAELVRGGLVRDGRRGPVDSFRGRLVWPIRDVSGNTVGFGARKLADDDTGPKYLNTIETPIYRKSQVLYGLDLAKREIAARRQAVVVEGYTDVMACHLAGVTTAVATCGTSFGVDHVAMLRRFLMDQDTFRGEVIFTFDGDAAGRKAAIRAFGEDQRFVAQTFVAVAADGRDPCELRMHAGDEAVRHLVASRVPLAEFVLRSRLDGFDLGSAEGKVGALRAAAPTLIAIRDTALRGEYVRRLAGWLGMEVEAVTAHVASLPGQGGEQGEHNGRPASRGNSPPSDRTVAAPAAPSASPVDTTTLTIERALAQAVVQRPDLVAAAGGAPPADTLVTDDARHVLRAAAAAPGGVSGAAWVDQLTVAAETDTVRSLITALAVAPMPVGADEQRYVTSIVSRAGELGVTRAIADVRSKLQRTDPVVQEADYLELTRQLFALEQRKRELHDRAIGDL